jgi:hypothetical protein
MAEQMIPDDNSKALPTRLAIPTNRCEVPGFIRPVVVKTTSRIIARTTTLLKAVGPSRVLIEVG